MKSFVLGSILAAVGATAAIAMGVESSDPLAVPAGNYAIDPSHTSAAASVVHMGFSKTTVSFGKVSGTYTYDPAKPEASTLEVSIDAGSLNSGWAARDAHLKSPEFFNVAAFPNVTFKSDKLEKTGANTANVAGNLTLLGVTKPVTLAVTFNGVGKGMDGIVRTGFAAITSFKRSEFGMKTFLPAVGDDVSIVIEAEFAKK